MKVVLATKNPGKLRELKELAGNVPALELVLAPDGFDPEETGSTFMENAILKAREAAQQTGLHAVADDSGIEVYVLDNRPGIYSARYCPGTDTDRRVKLWQEVRATDQPQSKAAYVCAMALCDPAANVIHTAEARWEGEIATEEKGQNGFGYDPIFFLKEFNRTAAELSPEEKNEVSHRAKAWRDIVHYIERTNLR